MLFPPLIGCGLSGPAQLTVMWFSGFLCAAKDKKTQLFLNRRLRSVSSVSLTSCYLNMPIFGRARCVHACLWLAGVCCPTGASITGVSELVGPVLAPLLRRPPLLGGGASGALACLVPTRRRNNGSFCC